MEDELMAVEAPLKAFALRSRAPEPLARSDESAGE